MKQNNYIAIMAGGVGSRFWPASRESQPKQFIDMLGMGRSLLQMTYDRFLPLVDNENIFCVTNDAYFRLVADHLPHLPKYNIIGEPSRNNTAPSVLLTAILIANNNPDAVIGFVPSDHLILKDDYYRDLCEEAFNYARDNEAIVTLGIQPTRPDTGFGYINYNKSALENNVHKVIAFHEKPELEKAISFIESGDYLWNAGMFFMSVKTLFKSYEKLAPELFQKLAPLNNAESEEEIKKLIAELYPQTPNLSIDYAIIEKSEEVFTIPSDIGWSDLGTWASLFQEVEKDENGNAIMSKHVILENVNNTLVKNSTDKLIILRDIEDLIIVEEEDVLMIYPMSKEQEIKQLGAKVKDKFDRYL
ncbi:MAG TPA: mannose-1-phosphate guanylyltransferase [Saprospiraceae bacterium]|nr:mannose-1-phosphate guanylyltransferase [Saprospiraceae bacterium]